MLSGKQVRYLRGLGHHLQPVVMVGKDEITPQVISSVDHALTDHELIKIKLQEGCITPRAEIASKLAEATDAHIAQVLGRTILLYRASENDIISLPSSK